MEPVDELLEIVSGINVDASIQSLFLSKKQFYGTLNKVSKCVGHNMTALSKLADTQKRARQVNQLKELAKEDIYKMLKERVDALKDFCLQRKEQREFGLEKRLGANALSLPSNVIRTAKLVGLEVYNSLSDEKKIYLNNEDTLIEIKYDVDNEQVPVCVDISYNEKEEEIKLNTEAEDIQYVLMSGNQKSLEAKLKALIAKTSLAKLLIKNESSINLRSLEDEMGRKLKNQPTFKGLRQVIGGLQVPLKKAYRVDLDSLQIIPATKQYVMIFAVNSSGKFYLEFSPPLTIPSNMLQQFQYGANDEEGTVEIDTSVALELSYLNAKMNPTNRHSLEQEDLKTIVKVESRNYEFTLCKTGNKPKNTEKLRQISIESSVSDIQTSSLCRIWALANRVILFNSAIQSCFHSENISLVRKAQNKNDIEQVIEPSKKRSRILYSNLTDASGNSEQAVPVMVRCFPGVFKFELTMRNDTMQIKLNDEGSFVVEGGKADQITLKKLSEILDKTNSLILLVYYYDHLLKNCKH